jgi:acetyltransferase-like isoleucine patch superfamily enzyme
MSAKTLLCGALWPLARIAERFGPRLTRLWSFARLSAGMRGAVQASVVLEGPVALHGTRRITLGGQLHVYPGQHWETQGQGEIVIGDGVVLSRGVHLVAHAGLRIGAGTMVGEYASLRDANHRRGHGPLRHSGHVAARIVIGSNVWIGRGAVVLAGVTIGDDAVIGANAVVTRDVAAGAVVGGVPARPLAGTGHRPAQFRPAEGW